jgi:hypothetical protein
MMCRNDENSGFLFEASGHMYGRMAHYPSADMW